MGLIFHIAAGADWARAEGRSSYEVSTLETEGFIHCSKRSQVLRVAAAHFAGRDDLVLLFIEESRVIARVVHEDLSASGEAFPHIYGPLNRDAVVEVRPFPRGRQGSFTWPPRSA